MRLDWKYFQRWRFTPEAQKQAWSKYFYLEFWNRNIWKSAIMYANFISLASIRVWLDILCQFRPYKLKFLASHEKFVHRHEQVSFYCLQSIILCSHCLWACSSGVQDGAYSWWRSHPPCGSYFLWCVLLTNTFAIMHQAFVLVCLWKVSCRLTNYKIIMMVMMMMMMMMINALFILKTRPANLHEVI